MQVRVKKWNGFQQEDFVDIASKVLLPVVERDIVLSVPHGNKAEPVDDGDFHIHIWSSPTQVMSGDYSPESIWEIPVDNRSGGYTYSGKGICIIDSETGWVVAELFDSNNLYIYHDLSHSGTVYELRIFEMICEETAKLPGITYVYDLEKSRAMWVEANMGRHERNISNTRTTIKKTQSQIEKLKRELIKQVRIQAGQDLKLSQLLATSETIQQKYAMEFDKMMKTPKITRIVMASDKRIDVYTNELHITTDDGSVYLLGRCRIEIFTDGSYDGVRFFNLDRQVNAFWDGGDSQHPHVKNDGTACLGTISTAIPELIGQNQYAAVALVAIRFLESVNTSDPAGARVIEWPKLSGPVTAKED